MAAACINPNEFKLNYPFALYPGMPFVHGYYDLKTYVEDVCTLEKFISRLTNEISKPTILHITIGAAIEENYPGDLMKIGAQYQQLFPVHLYDAFVNSTYDIINIIISPNNTFSKNHFIPPVFIQAKDDLGWKVIGDRAYSDETERFKVYIFCTPMPSNHKRNGVLVDYWKTKFVGQEHVYNVESLRQSENDYIFTSQFYKTLDTLFSEIEKMNGFVTCFSFAVFNAMSDRAKYDDFVMFNEIKELFDRKRKHQFKRLLAEWRFTEKNFNMYRCPLAMEISYDAILNPYGNFITFSESGIYVKRVSKFKPRYITSQSTHVDCDDDDVVNTVCNNQESDHL